MDTIKDVLLYLARHVPASPADLAAMETVIGDLPDQPAAAAPEQQPPG